MDDLIFGLIILFLGALFIFVGVFIIKKIVINTLKLNNFQKINLLTIFAFILIFILLFSRYNLFKSLLGSILSFFFIRIGYILYNNYK